MKPPPDSPKLKLHANILLSLAPRCCCSSCLLPPYPKPLQRTGGLAAGARGAEYASSSGGGSSTAPFFGSGGGGSSWGAGSSGGGGGYYGSGAGAGGGGGGFAAGPALGAAAASAMGGGLGGAGAAAADGVMGSPKNPLVMTFAEPSFSSQVRTPVCGQAGRAGWADGSVHTKPKKIRTRTSHRGLGDEGQGEGANRSEAWPGGVMKYLVARPRGKAERAGPRILGPRGGLVLAWRHETAARAGAWLARER